MIASTRLGDRLKPHGHPRLAAGSDARVRIIDTRLVVMRTGFPPEGARRRVRGAAAGRHRLTGGRSGL